MKALIGDTIFTSPTGDRTTILHGHPSDTKVEPFAGHIKAVPSFVSYLKTASVGLTSGIELATSSSAVKSSTD